MKIYCVPKSSRARWARAVVAGGGCSSYRGFKIEICLSDGESDQGWYDFFYYIEGWEFGYPVRVADGGASDLILQFQLKRGDDGMKRYQKMKWRRRRGSTRDGKGRSQCQLNWRKFYWTKNRKKIMWSIQLLQMNSEYLKQRCINLNFLKTYISGI
jgi:hypothetical protein